MKISKGSIDGNGMVRIYDIPSDKWVRRTPVDAREYVANGTGSTRGPCVAVVHKESGKLDVICPEQWAEFEAAGWERRGGLGVDAEVDEETDTDSQDLNRRASDEDAYNFAQHNVPQLKAFAEIAKIKEAAGMTKKQLLKVLHESEYMPTEQEVDSITGN